MSEKITHQTPVEAIFQGLGVIGWDETIRGICDPCPLVKDCPENQKCAGLVAIHGLGIIAAQSGPLGARSSLKNLKEAVEFLKT